jgi:metal-responsive CopG/Arc/MetJ family transcriptional regulator
MTMPREKQLTPKARLRAARLQVMLTEAALSALDDFCFETGLPNRAAAFRELLRRGLADEDSESPPGA